MQIGKRMMMGAGGPKLPYDAEVEYLESTGTQWIDTGIVPTAQTAAVLTGQFSRLQGRTRFGCRSSASNGQFCVLSVGANGIRFDLGSGTHEDSQWEVMSDATRLDLSAKVNAARLTSPTGEVFSHGFASTMDFSNYPILLFAFNNGGTPTIAQSMVVSSLRISDGGVLVRDMIPVRFTNELGQPEGAMYDRANPTVGMNTDGSARTDGLYRNQGTGAFQWGPDVG